VNRSEYGYDIWFEKTVMNGLVSGRKSLVVSGINHRYSHHRLTTFTLLLVQGTRRPTPDRSHLMAPQYEHNVVSPRKRCLFDDDDDERISTTRAAQYSTRHWGGLAGTRGYSCRHYSPASQHNCPVETPIDNRPPARPPRRLDHRRRRGRPADKCGRGALSSGVSALAVLDSLWVRELGRSMTLAAATTADDDDAKEGRVCV